MVPNSIVKILQNIPLDNTYSDSLTFDSESAQSTYFLSQVKYSRTDFPYQGAGKPLIMDINAESLYDCNYIMFKNANYGSKWFYAFITNVEFRSPETSMITYEIDVLQTWYFDYQLQPSFVVREHPATDAMYANLVEENLEMGELITRDYTATGFDPYESDVIVATTIGPDMLPITPQRYGYVYSGVGYIAFSNNPLGGLDAYLEALSTAGKIDAVVSMFMFPRALLPAHSSGDVLSATDIFTDLHTVVKNQTDIDGYTPHNKKLLAYPYNFLAVSNGQGQGAALRYEYFGGTNCGFDVKTAVAPSAHVFCIPREYKGQDKNIDAAVSFGGFPMCAWSYDVYRNWLAQNQFGLILGAASSVASIAAAAAAAGPVGAAAAGAVGAGGASPFAMASGAFGAANVIGSMAAHDILPPQAKGNLAPGGTAFSLGLLNFRFLRMTITAQFAKRIDHYFDMYGYKIGDVKQPVRSGRPHWNYIQTMDVCITGSVPARAMAIIKGCYNRGITFWHNPANVGNYSLDNRV